jgi:2-hydroxychromene-2-carboxylate isomerase
MRAISMPRQLDLYFFVGSTYSHLAVNRAGALAAAHGVALNWRPFSVRTLMREQNNSPFVGKPVKMAYMWRDLERRARRFGIPFDGVPPYPIDPQERANHVATLAAMEGWCEPFVREAYRTWFGDKLDPGNPDVLARIVATLGRPADCVERAEQPDVVARYVAQTDSARKLGLFGSPSFVHAGQELFWGDDRLEEAIEWACTHDQA